MAAQGVPMRTLQEMMGHRDFKTTLIYADYARSAREAEWIDAAFAPERVADPDLAALNSDHRVDATFRQLRRVPRAPR
jgi:hypothetical protein